MAGKALNKKNLLDLGADTLADLLLEAVKGDAARQRRVRMALSADLGPEALKADVRKRFAAIRRGRSYISRKAQRTLAKELTDLGQIIDQRITPEDADAAFELYWTLLHLGEGIHERTDDSQGMDVSWQEYPMGHQVCTQELQAVRQWLISRLS